MNITINGKTSAVQVCRECAAVGYDAISFEFARFPRLALIAFECPVRHLQFEPIPEPSRTPHQQAA